MVMAGVDLGTPMRLCRLRYSGARGARGHLRLRHPRRRARQCTQPLPLRAQPLAFAGVTGGDRHRLREHAMTRATFRTRGGHLTFYDLRDTVAGDLRAGRVRPTPEALAARAATLGGTGQAEAAEFTERFLRHLERNLARARCR